MGTYEEVALQIESLRAELRAVQQAIDDAMAERQMPIYWLNRKARLKERLTGLYRHIEEEGAMTTSGHSYILTREELRSLPKRKRASGDGRTIPICVRGPSGSLIGYKYAEPLVGMRLRHSFDPGTYRVREVGEGEMLIVEEGKDPHRPGAFVDGRVQWVEISDEWSYDWHVDLARL